MTPSPTPGVPELLAELDRLEAAATKGPWHWCSGESTNWNGAYILAPSNNPENVFLHGPQILVGLWPEHEQTPEATRKAEVDTYANTEFVAALRNAWPQIRAALLAPQREETRAGAEDGAWPQAIRECIGSILSEYAARIIADRVTAIRASALRAEGEPVAKFYCGIEQSETSENAGVPCFTQCAACELDYCERRAAEIRGRPSPSVTEAVEGALTDEVLGKIEYNAQEASMIAHDAGTSDGSAEYGAAWRTGIAAAIRATLKNAAADTTQHTGKPETAPPTSAAAPSGQTVADGWQLAPCEPTQDMMRASGLGPSNARFVYRAMLSAAPLPAALAQGESGRGRGNG